MNGPEHYRRAEALGKHAARFPNNPDALVLAQLATAHATLALTAATVEQAANAAIAADINSLALDCWYPLTHGPQEKAGAQLETEPAVAYVYKAAWGMTPLGTYTNSAAARTHCEDDASNNNPGAISFDWLGDESEPDAPYELAMTQGGVEEPAEYTVTRVAVAAEYDPEADA